MAKDTKKNEEKKSSFVLEENEEINTSALTDVSKDEDTITKALSGNGFILFLKRNFIKIKNHITIIPLIMVVVSLIVISFNIPTHVAAQILLNKNRLNSFYFFLNLLAGVLLVLLYLNVHSKKSSNKRKIFSTVLFYVVVGASLFLDIDYLIDMNIQTSLFNSINAIKDDPQKMSMATSKVYTIAHISCLGVTTFLAILAPIVQPFTKKIHLK